MVLHIAPPLRNLSLIEMSYFSDTTTSENGFPDEDESINEYDRDHEMCRLPCNDAIEEFFASLCLTLNPERLQFEDGDVIIKLGESPQDHLVLHQSVLGAASQRFATRFNSHCHGGRIVVSPRNGESVTVYEYHLKFVDGTFSLTDEGEQTSAEDNVG